MNEYKFILPNGEPVIVLKWHIGNDENTSCALVADIYGELSIQRISSITMAMDRPTLPKKG